VTATRYKTEAEAGDRSDTPWKKQFFSRDPDGPVVQVSWNDARKFCEWSGVSLPTEAQWEYACRAGTQSRFYFGDEDSKLGEYAWYYENSGGGVLKKRGTHPVGQKKPNAWGLYDMHGNAWEWCHDRYGDYPMTSVTDPARTTSGGNRVLRGGSWCNIPRNCRTADRIRIKPSGRLYSLGFRLVLAVQRK
jgi:formylglycine-generating enzyme required for sulfatase activity